MFQSYLKYQKDLALVLVVLLSIGSLSCPAFAGQGFNTAPVANYEVVDLSADATDNSDVIDISGGIKNYTYAPIKGRAIVYLLDSNQSVLQAIETDVNDSAAFRHGQVGHFDTTVNISGFSNVQSVSVEFVMNHF